MAQQQENSKSVDQSSKKQNGASQTNMSSGTNSGQVEQAYVSSKLNAQTAANVSQQQNTAQQPSAANTSQPENTVQQMSYETGLDYTSDVIRQEKLKPKNQKAANSLVDRMYWQHEESISKGVSVNQHGELEDYDDTPGIGNDKPGL